MWNTACDGNDCLHSLSDTLEVFSVFDAELFFQSVVQIILLGDFMMENQIFLRQITVTCVLTGESSDMP